MTCGGNVMYFGAKGVKGVTQAQIRTLCKESGGVWNAKSKTCDARKVRKSSGKGPSKSALVQKAMRATCRADGMVYNAKAKKCVAPKARAGPRPASLRVRTSNAASMKQIRAACNKEGLVYDTKKKMCRPSKVRVAKPKPSPKPKAYGPAKKPTNAALARKAMTAVCRADGMVYDAKAKKCRDARRRRALAAFGLMHNVPANWPQGTAYYQAPKFSKPDLLLGKAFETVANKAATAAAAQVATKAASVAVNKAIVKAMS